MIKLPKGVAKRICWRWELRSIRVERKWEDCWVGAYWKLQRCGHVGLLDVWICIIPCFPLHLRYHRKRVELEGAA